MSAPENSNIVVDSHWGLVPAGEAARVLGAGDPSEIVAGTQPAAPVTE